MGHKFKDYQNKQEEDDEDEDRSIWIEKKYNS